MSIQGQLMSSFVCHPLRRHPQKLEEVSNERQIVIRKRFPGFPPQQKPLHYPFTLVILMMLIEDQISINANKALSVHQAFHQYEHELDTIKYRKKKHNMFSISTR